MALFCAADGKLPCSVAASCSICRFGWLTLSKRRASDDDDAAAGRGGGRAEAERTAPGDDVVAGWKGSMGDAVAMAVLVMR